MPARKGNTITELNVGRLVRTEQKRQRLTHAILARRMNRNQGSIKSMLSHTSIQTYLVWELSVALGHNFFTDLAQQLDAATEGTLSAAKESELEQLKKEYQRLKEERDYLRKAVDLLSKK